MNMTILAVVIASVVLAAAGLRMLLAWLDFKDIEFLSDEETE